MRFVGCYVCCFGFVCAFRLIGWVGGCYDVALWFNLLVVSVGSAVPCWLG